MNNILTFEGVEQTIKALGGIKFTSPQMKKVSYAGAKTVMPFILSKVPVRTGALKRAIELRREKSNARKQKHYTQVTVDSGNRQQSTFQKRNKNGEVVAYYPASQEFGWRTSRENVAHATGTTVGSAGFKKAYKRANKVVQGKYFMQGGNKSGEQAALAVMGTELVRIINKVAAQRGLGG